MGRDHYGQSRIDPKGNPVTLRLAVIALACLLVFSVPATSAVAQPALPADPPNIVMFYIDDTPPHDRSLWDDPSRTPNIHEHFIANGINFPKAIGEDPLCCPER